MRLVDSARRFRVLGIGLAQDVQRREQIKALRQQVWPPPATPAKCTLAGARC